MRDLDLPRGPDREIVHDARDREYTLRGSETRTLSTVGAFGSSRHAISATTTSVLPIRGPATSDISARKGSSERSDWTVIGTSLSS